LKRARRKRDGWTRWDVALVSLAAATFLVLVTLATRAAGFPWILVLVAGAVAAGIRSYFLHRWGR
jgi:hypothetical protein